MHIRNAIAVALAATLAGCAAPPQLSREEGQRVVSRSYAGVTKDQVLNAGQRVLELADAEDVRFAPTGDGFLATRPWSVYIVLAATFGTDNWQFKTESAADGSIRATTLVTTQIQGSGGPTSRGIFGTNLEAMTGEAHQGTAVYELYWARVEYLLGKRAKWMTCDEAQTRLKQGATTGSLDPLCNSFNVKDETPSEPMVKSR